MRRVQTGIVIVSVLYFLSTIRAAPIETLDDGDDDPSRLPRNSIPLSYDIALTTNVHTGDRSFSGIVKIEIKIIAETEVITLHNNGLTRVNSRLWDNNIDDIPHTVSYDASRHFMFINRSDGRTMLVDDNYNIEISYTGLLDQNMNGFYISWYRTGTETRYLASTQFQSIGARAAFICYDEPEYKATFKLAITHDSDYSAISNTLSSTNPNGDGTSTTVFEETPVMSTYLLAFVVSDFGYLDNEVNLPEGDTLQRIYTRRDEVLRAEYALKNSIEFLKQLEDWADYKYKLRKVFSAAIPDFAAGAMENWGLITYKEQYLIVEETSHPRERFDSLRVIAHELGHQFFGNVVTCKWWNYIWLNEGYATVLEYLLVEREYPELRMNDLFNVIKVQGAFRPDALESSHPMTYDGQTQSSIIYDKAGSVIRMFQYAVGDDLFRDAMSHYLNTNEYQPVTSDDLYQAVETTLTQSSFNDFPFTAAFKTWENQKGYPVIHVSTDDSTRVFHVTQQRYLALTEKEANPSDPSKWYIPLNFATASNPNFDDTKILNYFADTQTDVTIPYPTTFTSNEWFVFNKQQIGYYRVNYDASNWQQIIRVLNSDNFKDIHVANRAQLIDDALNLAADEYLDYETAFGILSYLERETDYIPWRAVTTNLDKLDFILASQPESHNNFQRFIRKLARLMYVTYGLEERPLDSMLDQFARELVIDWTCRMKDEGCLRDTYSYLQRITFDNLEVPKSLEITYMCNGLRGLSRQTEFQSLWDRMLDSNDQSERIRIIDGLLCSSDPQLLRNLLSSTILPNNPHSYRTHETQRIWGNVLTRSFVGIDTLIDFINDSYVEIQQYSGSQIQSTINAISQRIVSLESQARLVELIDKLIALPANPLNPEVKTNVLRNFDVNNKWISSDKFVQATSFVNSVIGAIDEEENQMILPKTSKPNSYRIHITATDIPDGGRYFSGEIEIDAQVIVATDRIMLHSREQTILEVKAYYKTGMIEIPVFDYSNFQPAHTLSIYFSAAIPADSEVILRIKYEAIMQAAAINYGFHIASYEHEGETRYLGVTQFESSLGSRFAFPHYDEPRYKAKFQLTLTHSNRHNAMSNTVGEAVPNGDGTTTTTFEETPVMSSYLLAFVISDLVHISNANDKEQDETLHNIWVRPDSIGRAWFALESSVGALKELEKYLNFKFALPKMDSAGIPNKSGAMENWGMITYWETAMIYQLDYQDISHALRLSGVDVIAHEEAHQFFGNAATFEWWDYLWLSEGFATLFEYQISGALHPEWRTNHFFNIRELHNAFRADSRDTTRSMTPNPSLLTPTEIRASFDTIAYDKSGSVVRMFQNVVGDQIFQQALNLYLTDNQFKSVVPQNLYDAFQTVIDSTPSFTSFDFAAAFGTWETQKGYPIIYVTYLAGTRQFQITQERYFTEKPSTLNDTNTWFIPLNFATKSSSDFEDTSIRNYFVNGQPSTLIDAPATFDASEWFVFNKQQLGYYRVNYDVDNWNAIIETLNSPQFEDIHVLNRVQLVDDAVNFAAGNYIEYDLLFKLLQYLRFENEYTPWFSADRFISQLYTTFGPFNPDLNLFVRHLSKRFYDNFKLGSDNAIPLEEVYERYGREIATRLACNSGNEACLSDTFNLIKQFVVSERAVPKGLEGVVLCNSLKGTDKNTEWTQMFDKAKTTTDATLRTQILTALGCSGSPALLRTYLEAALDTANGFTQNEQRNIFGYVLNSNVGLEVVIDFMKEHGTLFGYTFEQMITVPARTVKTRAQQTSFNNYLQSVDNIDAEVLGRVNTIVTNNFLAQEQSFYPQVMRLIQDISENQLRLPKTTEPKHYKLHLDARNIPTGDRAFTGEVEIEVRINEATDRITIHSKTQVIDAVQVFGSDKTTVIEVFDYHLYPETDTLTIYFVNPLNANDDVFVNIKYTTDLVLTATGFYQTSYVINGETRYLGATQFESTGGRYAFPHYDEPGYKTVFDLSITHHASHTAIANTFGETQDNPDGTKTTTFGPSPPMSSYLLAFVVSDLQSVDNEDTREPDETLHRVWVRPDSLAKAPYAVDVSARVLKAMEEYIGFDYELPKVDSAGVPNKGGAMENWGMVTYRENAMIYEENYEDISHIQKLSGVDVIAHELAHQFFGDSVTCEWWDYIWLNEGFATLFEYHLMGILYPDWRVKDLFNIRTMQSAFRNDAREQTRAMTKPLLTPAEISGAFDYVVYAKAGSVLRMFQYTVGEDIFTAALKLFLETNNHQAINSQPLVDAFAAEMATQGLTAFDFDVAFRSWELQKGYPVIHASYSGNARQFIVTQQRFFTRKNESEGDTSSWYIPLNFATASSPNFDDTSITNYFVAGVDQYPITAPANFEANQWFVFNKQQLGYYRVNYDIENWNALTQVLNSDNYNNIHVLNRAQLVDDAISFVEGDYLSHEVLLNLITYLRREVDYPPWFAADRFIASLYSAFGPRNENLNKFINEISETYYDTFKLPDDGVILFEELFPRFTRELALKLACNAGNQRCLSDTFNVVRQLTDGNHPVPKGLEQVVLCSGMKGTGKQGQWEELQRLMQTATDANFKSQALIALGCTDDTEIQTKFLESTLGNSFTQAERRSALTAILNTQSGLVTTIDFIRSFEVDILTQFGYSTLEALLNVPAGTIKTRNDETVFNNFVESLAQLDAAALNRIKATVSNNFAVQQQSPFVEAMKFIDLYFNPEDPETTEPTTVSTTESTTTPSTTTPPDSGASTVKLQLATLFAGFMIFFVKM